MSDTATAGPATVTSDGFTVTSTTESVEQITESLKPEPEPAKDDDPIQREPDPKLSKAASKLGKAGGEATAAKRAEAQEAEAEGTSEEDDLAAAEQLEKEGKLGKPRHDAKARMLQKAREAKALKAEVERERSERTRLAAELEQLRAGKAPAAAAEAPKPAEKAAGPEKPKEEDFDSYADFVEALADYKAEARLQSWQKQTQEQARVSQRHAAINNDLGSFFSRMEEAAKTDASIRDRTAETARKLQFSFQRAPGQPLEQKHVIADEILQSEHAPMLMSHLSEHPEDLQRIQALQTIPAIQREMAKLEGRLSAATTSASAPHRPEVSQARPPVRAVAGSPHSGDREPDSETASFDEHLKYWNSKDKRRA